MTAITSTDAANYTVDVTNACGTITSATAALTVSPSVAITTQPSDVTDCDGANVSFSVTASNATSYQWKKNGTNITGETASTLSLTSITGTDAANYTVDVTNSCGTITSATAALTVSPAVAITTQPSDVTDCDGANVSFSVTASNATSYQWKKNGTAITGETASTLNLASITSTDAANYTVDVTNTCGTITSATAALTVSPAVAITTQPSDVTDCDGANVSFSVTASNATSYQWKKNGTAITGETSATLNLASITSADAANYTVDVTNTCGTITSATAALTVSPAVAITTQPSDVTDCEGANVSFSVTASNATSYQWKKNGTAITGETASTLNLASITSADAANYTVDVTNSCGTITSATAALTVSPAVAITTQPADVTDCDGANVSFSVTASNATSYQWKKNGTNITGETSATLNLTSITGTDAANYTVDVTNSCGTITSATAALTVSPAVAITTQPSDVTDCDGANVSFSVTASNATAYQWKKNGTAITGETSATLNLTAITSTDAANYTVDVTNACGTITSATAALTVSPSVAITTQPSDVTDCDGANVSFSVTASNATSYQWKKNGTNITGETASTLSLTSITGTDAANYTVDVTNSCGTITSATAALTVSPAVAITTQPSDVTDCDGANVSFSVTASNATSYQWKKNGTAITGETASTLNLASITSTDAANYTVDVTNTCGTITSATAALTVSPAVAITTQPSDVTDCDGANVSFSVTASNATSYQWKKNGTNITGETASTLNLASITSADAANYTVDVTNSCGTITSATAALTVSPSVAITTQPSDVTDCDGANVSFSVTASNATSYQWKKNGTAITGETSATLNLTSITGTDAANYTVDVTNTCGTITSATAALTVSPAVAITTQPSDVTDCDGANVSFSVTASNATSYQWKKNGTNITGETASTLNLASITSADAANYTVDVTNSCGTITSATAALTVSPAVAITTQPSDVTDCEGANVSFSVTASNATSYQWKKNGTNITGETASTLNLASITSTDAANYTVDVTNTCGTITSATAALTVNTAPASPSGFTAATSVVCQGTNGVAYNIASVAGATGYTWSYSGTGATINGTGTSVTVDYSGSATSGTLSVTADGACGSSSALTMAITVNQTAAQAGNFTASKTPVVQGETGVTYTVPAVGGVTYTWSYSGTGGTINGTGNSITMDFSSSATSGTLSVTANNGSCGNSASRDLAIQVDVPPTPQPAPFTASQSPVCEGTSGVTYTVPAAATTSYLWSYSGTGVTINGTGNSVTLDYAVGATSGTLSVVADNGGGPSVARTMPITVNPTTATPSAINGSATVTTGTNLEPYDVSNTLGTTYTWTYSGTGTTINGSGNAITMDFSSSATSGTLSVTADNGTGCTSASSDLAINVTAGKAPQPTSFTTSTSSVCPGVSNIKYEVPFTSEHHMDMELFRK